MAEETITILKVGTEEAVKSVNDLKDNIKSLKQNLGELEIGTEEYQNTLEELKVNQNALKDAMYATTTSMADVAAAATGASKSYNSLVHQMAALKEEWRATNDEARRSELGAQIAEINQQLKDMDASVGNFSRNVGNYESGTSVLVEKFDKFGGILKQMPPTLGAAKEQIGKVGETMQLVGKQPILSIIGLLAPIIIKITGALKENQTAMDAVKRLMSSLDPIMKLFEKALEGVAKAVAKVADWLGRMIGKVTERFTQAKEEAENLGDAVTEGIEEATPDAVKAAESMGEKMAEAIENKLMEIDWDKVSAANAKRIEAEKKIREAAAKEQQEITDMIEADWEQTNAEIDAYFEEMWQKQQEDLQKQRELAQAKIDSMYAVADATSSVLGSIASMYESDEKSAEKNADKIKALRIAEATINTISGAIGAYMSAVTSIPAPYGIIVGAAQAASVTAAGIAQIAQMKKTKVGSSGASSAPSAIVSAPMVETSLPSVRSVTSATEEERLNQMAKDQRVYIVSSDIEAALDESRTRVEESSF
jgi:chromosome segregation ATPase